MCVTAVDSLSRDNDISETDSIFVAAYVFLFAVILFFFELTQFKSIPKLDKAYKANFGFLYKPISKGIFLIFVGFLQFGLDASQILSEFSILLSFEPPRVQYTRAASSPSSTASSSCSSTAKNPPFSSTDHRHTRLPRNQHHPLLPRGRRKYEDINGKS